ncbi:MAG: hypothetical protein FJ316_02755 [SAR202 cluster bacterium]|nr:hypothetical protein [SAR202 cluster bacterium]
MSQAELKLDQYRQSLTQELQAVFAQRQGFLYNLLRYHLGWTDQQGGPEEVPAQAHWRSLLTLAVADGLGKAFQSALPSAAAIELVHSFTLAHADVQAGRTAASARPSIWWVWGPAQAINAGDGLHALCRVALLHQRGQNIPAERVLQAVEALDRACLALCEGQYLDLSFQDQLLVTRSQYLDMAHRKSGALAGCAAELGALASATEDPLRPPLREAGAALGTGVQIRQDIHDLWGKHGDGLTPSNLLNKKKGLPLVCALEKSTPGVKRELGAIYMKRVLEPADVSRILEILDAAGGRAEALKIADNLVSQGMDKLSAAGIADQTLETVRFLVQGAVESPT